MYVNGHHFFFSGNVGQSSQSDSTFNNTRVHRDISAGSNDIDLTHCETVGNMTAGSADVRINGGTLHGLVRTGSGDISAHGGAVVTGSLVAGSGDIRITANSLVIAADQTRDAVQTGSGNIHVTDATVNGQISSGSGNIALNNATIEGNVTSKCNGISIDGSTVAGTLTAVGERLRIGDQSTIENVVLKLPQEVDMHALGNGSQTIFRSHGVTIINGNGGFFSSPGITIVNGNLIGGHLVPANASSRSVPRINSQTIHLGAGTKVDNIAFEAAHCKVVLDPGAQYSGHRPQGMTVERQEGCPPRIAARECAARITRQTTNPAAAAPRHVPPATSSSTAGSVTLPPSTDFSTRAEAVRIRAMEAVFDTSIRGAGDRHARQEKMSDIGDQYLEGLQGPHASKVFLLISEMMTPEDKAKVLTSICYSTLVSADLDRDNPVCDQLQTLCKASTDIAETIKGHIKKVDGTGIHGGLSAPVTGGFSMLKQADGRLPYATQMMLDTLGIR